MAVNKVPEPVTREYGIGQLVNELEKEERRKPDIAYVFSNGRAMLSTDQTDNGFYRK